MNIIFVIPNSSYRFETKSHFSIESLGVSSLAGAFKQKSYFTRVIDAYALNLNSSDVAALVTKDLDSSSVICLSFMQHTTLEASRIAKEIRKIAPTVTIIGGGWGPTMAPTITQRFISEIDVIVVGSDVNKIVDVVSKNYFVPNKSKDAKIINVGKSLPVHQYFKQLRNAHHYIAQDEIYKELEKTPIPIISSIGCSWGKCTFCSSAARWGKKSWFGNTAENIVNELTKLVEKFNTKKVSFVDDSFFGPNEQGFDRAQLFVNLMKSEKLPINFMLDCCIGDFDKKLFSDLVEVGLSAVFIGIENISSTVLKRFGKKFNPSAIYNAIESIRDLGIEIIPGYITFDPYMTMKEATDSVQFIKDTFPKTFEEKLFNEMIPHVGTEYFSSLERDHMISGEYPKYDVIYRDTKVWEFKNLLQSSVIKKKGL